MHRYLPQPADPARPPAAVALDLGRVAHVAVAVAAGLALCSVAEALSRATLAPSPWIYWAGVAAIVGPIAYRLTSDAASTGERIALVCMLGLSLYAVKLMRDPFGFTLPDEFSHAYNAEQILSSRRLFSSNPLLPVTPDFPGLEGATSAIASLTRMSSFGAGVLTVGAARLTLMLALFSLFATVTGSPRAAGLGAAAYAGNSNFLLWGAQYAYESLSLPLLVVVLACIAERHSARRTDRRAWAVPVALVIAAIVPTHHLTSFLLVGLLALLSAAQLLPARFPPHPKIWPFALLACALTLTWLTVAASRTVGYISPVLSDALNSTLQTISGESPPHALFSSTGVAAGQANQLGEQLIGIAEVLILLAALPFGLRVAWRRHRRNPLALLLALGAVGFFGVTALRLVPSGWEISNRTAEFLFIGLAFVVCLVPVAQIAIRGRKWTGRALVAAAAAMLVVGGAITGWPANSRLSRPTEILAHGALIQSQTAALGHWAAGLPGGTLAAPDADAFAIALYGRRSQVLTGFDASADEILAAPRIQAWQLALWRRRGVRYAVVDLRRRATDFVTGFYFDVRPPGGAVDSRQPSSVATKFDRLGAPRILDTGDIRVYDLGALP